MQSKNKKGVTKFKLRLLNMFEKTLPLTNPIESIDEASFTISEIELGLIIASLLIKNTKSAFCSIA